MRIQSIPAVYAFKGWPPGRRISSAPCPTAKSNNSSRVSPATPPGHRPSKRRWRWRRKRSPRAIRNRRRRHLRSDPRTRTRQRPKLSPGSPAARSRARIWQRRRRHLADVPPAAASHAEIQAARAALELAEAGQKDARRHRRARGAASRPTRRTTRRGSISAVALFAAGDRERAIDDLLDLVKPRARLERASGAQATGQILRGDGPCRSADGG